MQSVSLIQALIVSMLILVPVLSGKDLPRVLFLVDDVQRQIVDAAAKDLKGKADFVINSDAANTHQALEMLQKTLGDKKWDLIYFNYGIGDLVYRDPKSEEFRVMSKYSGGVRVSSPEEYEYNLNKIAALLKQSGANIVWATTTPIQNANAFPSYTGNLYDEKSPAEYNQIAGSVMKRHRIDICDLHSFIMKQYDEDENHPQFNGYHRDMQRKKKEPAHTPVVKSLIRYL